MSANGLKAKNSVPANSFRSCLRKDDARCVEDQQIVHARRKFVDVARIKNASIAAEAVERMRLEISFAGD